MMWDGLHSWGSSLPKTRQKPPNQSPLLTANAQTDTAPPPNCFSASAAMLTSWLNRRRRRYLLLILCSPFLIPLLCAVCPIFCLLELCYLMLRRQRKEAARGRDGSDDEVGLLQRYLEDQLTLVAALPEETDGLGKKGRSMWNVLIVRGLYCSRSDFDDWSFRLCLFALWPLFFLLLVSVYVGSQPNNSENEVSDFDFKGLVASGDY